MATGVAVALSALVLGGVAVRRGARPVLVLPAAAVAAWLLGPSLAGATESWDRPGPVVVAVVAMAVGFGAGGGAVAAVPLGTVGTTWALTVVAGAVALAVPDTEGVATAVTALGLVAVAMTAVERRRPGWWPVPAGAAATTAACVVLVALSGATAGMAAAVGATGCVTVLAGAAPLVRHHRAGGRHPVVPPWASVPLIACTSAAVARLGAVRSTTARALVVSVVGAVATAVGLELAARLTSGRARPRR